MTEEILERLSKIKSLAERGEGGEKENAEALLQRLLEKYDISEEELISDKVSRHEFRFWGLFGDKLLSQIIYAVTGGAPVYYYKYRSRQKIRLVDCTEAEAIEIQEMFGFYRHYLDEGFKTYYDAFVQAELLFPDDSKVREKEGGNTSEVSIEAYKLSMMLNKHERHLKIEEHSSSDK